VEGGRCEIFSGFVAGQLPLHRHGVGGSETGLCPPPTLGGGDKTGQLQKNREASPTPSLGGGNKTGQLHKKPRSEPYSDPGRCGPDWSARQNREAKALLRPWSVWATIHSQPLPNRPHIIRSNRPDIKAIHPKLQSPVSRGHLIHIRQNNLTSRLTIPNPHGEMDMVR